MTPGVFSNVTFRNRRVVRLRALTFAWWALGFGRFAGAVELATPTPAPTQALPVSGFAGLGSSFAVSSRLQELGWTDEQTQAFVEGVRAALRGKSYPFDEAARQVSGEMGRRLHELDERMKNKVSEYSQPGKLEQYLKETRKRNRLQQTPSGLLYRMEPGQGTVRPRPDDSVVFTCIAHAADGVTDIPQLSSENIRAKMKDLVPGLFEGLQMMTLESKMFLVLPPALLFGDGEWPAGMERGAPIQVELILHEVVAPTP